MIEGKRIGPGIYDVGGEIEIDEAEFILAAGGNPANPEDRLKARVAIRAVCADEGIPVEERERDE